MYDQLAEAQRLIDNGLKDEAVKILAPILRSDPRNAEAWWLMANAMREPDRTRYALEQVLRYRPDDERARVMLTRFGQQASSSSPIEGIPASDNFSRSTQSSFRNDDDYNDLFGEKPKFSGYGGYSPSGSAGGEFNPYANLSNEEKAKYGYNNAPIYVPGLAQNQRKSGCASPCLVIFAIFGLVTLIACVGLFLFAVTAGPQMINTIVDSIEDIEPTFAAELRTAVASGTFTFSESFTEAFSSSSSTFSGTSRTSNGSAIPAELNRLGTIEIGASATSVLASGVNDTYTFQGRAGQRMRFTVTALDPSSFDTTLRLYSPEGVQLEFNDDSGGGLNPQLDFTIPSNGTYRIIVSTYSGSGRGGEYVLEARER